MYLYNISIIVEETNQLQLLEWLKKEWLTQIDHEIKFLKMVDSPHEGFTYCVQIIVANKEIIQSFQQNHLSLLQQHISSHHHDKAFIFDSTMQYLTT